MLLPIPKSKKLKTDHISDELRLRSNLFDYQTRNAPQGTVNVVAEPDVGICRVSKVTVNSLLLEDKLNSLPSQLSDGSFSLAWKNVVPIQYYVPQGSISSVSLAGYKLDELSSRSSVLEKRSLYVSPVTCTMKQDYHSPMDQATGAQYCASDNAAPVSSLIIPSGREVLESSSCDYLEYGQLKLKIMHTRMKPNIPYDQKCQVMAQAGALGDLEMIKVMILKYGTHPGIKNNIAIIEASKAGHLHVVDYLMNNAKVNPVDQKHYAMKMAVQYGHLHILERLLQCPNADVSYDQNYAIRTASMLGFTDIVRRLLLEERVNPAVKDFYAVRHAAKNGHMEVVELLISDYRVNKSALLVSASKNKKAFGRLIHRLQSEFVE